MKRIGKRGGEERREREGGGAACVETRVALSSSMESCNILGQGENLKVSIKREVKKRSATMKLSRGGEGREGGGGRGRGSKGFIMRFVARELMPFRWSGCLHDTSSRDTTVYNVCVYIFKDIKIGTLWKISMEF